MIKKHYISPIRVIQGLAVMIASIPASSVRADGTIIDKVYHPYVQLFEKEIEYRLLYQDDDGEENDSQRHRLGFGHSLSDRFFAEAYLIGKDSHGTSFELDAVEAELKWQLTEQGEYDNDWGLLFELERKIDDNIWESSTRLIALHEWPDWIATANLSVIYEWGGDIENEWETSFAGQLRYRYSQGFEPAVELYTGEDTKGIGPVLTGLKRLGGRQKLWWEFGVILGLDNSTPDTNWKFNLEYEF